MIKTNQQIYLASKSPRRKKLLKQIGLSFKSFSVETREEIFRGENPISVVKRLSLEKLDAASKKVDSGIIITADTIVVLHKEIIGKPKNKKNAFEILSKLSNNTHFVYTGYAIKNLATNKTVVDYEKSSVTFRTLSKKEISKYINTGSPMDKAGAYGIQDDYGAVFVKKINGCYYNIVGLPLSKIYIAIESILDVS